jgi:hypothetical protein
VDLRLVFAVRIGVLGESSEALDLIHEMDWHACGQIRFEEGLGAEF